MKLTRDECKNIIGNILDEMLHYNPRYIEEFLKNDSVKFWENGLPIGDSTTARSEHPDVWSKLAFVEQKTECVVYAVTHEFLHYCDSQYETYSFLFVSQYDDELPYMCSALSRKARRFRLYAYVWNVTIPDYSELGSVIVEVGTLGGLRRVG